MDAVVVIAGPDGERLLPISDFFQGVRRTALQPGEVVVEIVVRPLVRTAVGPTCATRPAVNWISRWWASAPS